MTAPGVPLWVDLRGVPLNKRLPYLHAVRDAGVARVLLGKGDAHHERPGLATVAVDGRQRLLDGKRPIGRLVRVHDARSQASAAAGKGIVVVEAAGILPIENLVAARQDRPGTLFAWVPSSQDARLCAQALERGVHGVVLAPASPQEILASARLLADRDAQLANAPPAHAQAAHAPQVPPIRRSVAPAPPPSSARRDAEDAAASNEIVHLDSATLTRIEAAGLGDRVCVDTTSLLAPDEGLLVGSSAHSLALVLAETGGTDLAPARPFRVNAGALHGYTLAPEGRTCYLSELAAGRQVLVASAAGGLRCVTVGRAKLERRPHLVLHWETEDGAASVALQAAETVRLAVPGGGSLAVTDARPGHAILVARQPEGRHAGIAVDETVEER